MQARGIREEVIRFDRVNLSQHRIEGPFNIDVMIMKIDGIELADDDQALN